MPRTKISVPSTFHFSTQLTVRVGDLNYGNHLGNDRILTYLQEARVRMLAAQDMSELNIGDNTSLIQGDAEIIYKSEGFLGDQIEIELAVNDISGSSFDIVYQLTNTTTGKLLAIGKTRMVCFDYNTRKVQVVPASFKAYFTSP